MRTVTEDMQLYKIVIEEDDMVLMLTAVHQYEALGIHERRADLGFSSVQDREFIFTGKHL